MRALPHTYPHVPADPGVSVLIALDDVGGQLVWSLQAEPANWMLRHERSVTPTAQISLPAETLWRLASGRIDSDAAGRAARFQGDHRLAEPLLSIVSVAR